jgi:hypothetical protein
VAVWKESMSEPHHHDEDEVCLHCSEPVRSQKEFDERRARFVKDSLTKIEKHGWVIQAVMDSDETPGWAYTIGLRKYDHPEIVIVNLPPKVSHGVLNSIGDRVSKGEAFICDEFYDNLVNKYAVVFKKVPDPTFGDWFNVAEWIYGDKDWPVLQCWWPDFDGRFPWQEGYDHRYIQMTVGVDE